MKKIVGWLFVLIGIGVVGYGLYGMRELSRAQPRIHALQESLASNPMGDVFTDTIQERVDQYNTAVTWLLIGGTVCIVVGAGTLFFFRRK